MDEYERLRYPMKSITNPGTHDLLLGRGGEVNSHCGNVYFRSLINEYKERYRAAPRVDKPRVAADVVAHWRNLNPPGRFLTRTNPGESVYIWEDIGDSAARRRASKALGERDYKIKDKPSAFVAFDPLPACTGGAQGTTASVAYQEAASILMPQASVVQALSRAESDPSMGRRQQGKSSAFSRAPNSQEIIASPAPKNAPSSANFVARIPQGQRKMADASSATFQVVKNAPDCLRNHHHDVDVIQSSRSMNSFLIYLQEQQSSDDTKLVDGIGISLDPKTLPTAADLTQSAFSSSDSSGNGSAKDSASTHTKDRSGSDSSGNSSVKNAFSLSDSSDSPKNTAHVGGFQG